MTSISRPTARPSARSIPHPLGVDGGGIWTPRKLPNLAGLFIASSSNLVIATGAADWFNLVDGSGATDLIQATGSRQPAWDGSAWLNFSGSKWMVSTGLITTARSWSMLLVRKLNATTGSGYAASVGSTIAGNNGYGAQLDGSGNLELTAKGVSSGVDGAADTSAHDTIYTCDSSANVSLYIDNVSATLTPSSLTGILAPTVGTVAGAGFDSGAAAGNLRLGALVIMTSVITSADRAKFHAWRLANTQWS